MIGNKKAKEVNDAIKGLMTYFENVFFSGDLQRGWPVGRNKAATGLPGELSTKIDIGQIPKETTILPIVVLPWARNVIRV